MKTLLFTVKLIRKTGEDHVNAFAAQAAFFIILSVIPFILLLLTSIQITDISRKDLLTAVQSVIPTNFYSTVYSIINEMYDKSTAIIPLTAITALWSAARAVLAITGGLNSVYDVEESRNYIILRLRSAFYTVLLIGIITLALIMLVFGNSIHALFVAYFPYLASISAFVISIRTIGSLAIMVTFFAFVFKYLPNRKAPLLTQVPGAIFTAVAWTLFSYGFSIYLDVYNGLSNMYGSLTTIVLIMLWLYFCMYIMLLGGEVNVALNDKVLEMSQRRKQAREARKSQGKS